VEEDGERNPVLGRYPLRIVAQSALCQGDDYVRLRCYNHPLKFGVGYPDADDSIEGFEMASSPGDKRPSRQSP
jgi:hypothetical protein